MMYKNVNPFIDKDGPGCWGYEPHVSADGEKRGCSHWNALDSYCRIHGDHAGFCIPWYQNRIEELEAQTTKEMTHDQILEIMKSEGIDTGSFPDSFAQKVSTIIEREDKPKRDG